MQIHAADIGFTKNYRDIVSECADRRSRALPDSGQTLQLLYGSRKRWTMLVNNNLGKVMQKQSPSVISEPLPLPKDIRRARLN